MGKVKLDRIWLLQWCAEWPGYNMLVEWEALISRRLFQLLIWEFFPHENI